MAYSRELQEQADATRADAEVAEELRKARELREARLQDELQALQIQERKRENQMKDLTEE